MIALTSDTQNSASDHKNPIGTGAKPKKRPQNNSIVYVDNQMMEDEQKILDCSTIFEANNKSAVSSTVKKAT